MALEKLLNFRDVSSLLPQSSSSVIKPGKLYRSARPDEATPADRLVLASTLRSIIDLRTPTEHDQQAAKHRAQGLPAPSPIPRLSYHAINFNGPAFSALMVSRLSWPVYLRVALLMATGYRTAAIRLVARDAMEPRGVVGLLLDSLRVCGAEIATAFNAVLARPDAYPVLVHCTQGKDRTGLIVMLTLFLLGADEEAVQTDYMASGPALEPERDARVQEIAEIGLGDEWADVAPGLVHAVKEWLDAEFGGVEGYLESIGVERATQERVKQILSARGRN
ncbi:uncharacterized protein K452DRAFT_228414 [Aplosporella prunicola CBS 121167]|uniref:Tyrosine specific protein phosphatases domain-containing protein n=1 Tax=Aplosporella prunicola CBS 121167 TaxID=1176127 RepID=A0A6A6BBZ6_9PEZI|nr:uncharacterized protein K452DRAFT_228414 [Aplosporella prunicola CBS 121167]KAF2141729.1 hypothetical protein K452DRAFT_228414 [Aplosporella prunicola CBS 121167]